MADERSIQGAVLARPPRQLLPADQSEKQRDRLLAEVAQLQTAEDAAAWAHLSLPAKNALTTADARAVEETFRERLSQIVQKPASEPQRSCEEPEDGAPQEATDQHPDAPNSTEASSTGENPSSPADEPNTRQRRGPIAKTIRLRDKDHRKFVSTHPCLVCGRKPADPHHLRFAQPRALGRKVSDEFTVPVCRSHHHELHQRGDEAAWWGELNIDPVPIALALWRRSHPTAASFDGGRDEN